MNNPQLRDFPQLAWRHFSLQQKVPEEPAFECFSRGANEGTD